MLTLILSTMLTATGPSVAQRPITTCQWPNVCTETAARPITTCQWPNVCVAAGPVTTCQLPNRCG